MMDFYDSPIFFAIAWKNSVVSTNLRWRILIDARRDSTVAQFFDGDQCQAIGVSAIKEDAIGRELEALGKLRAVMEANGLPKGSDNG